MTKLTEFVNQMPDLISVFILMLSTFLIGYFSAWWFQKLKYSSLINRLKKEVNDAIAKRNINDIDTIFTELKPKIEETVKNNLRERLNNPVNKRAAAEKARSSYVSYNMSSPELDFDSFGYAEKSNKDDLTLIKGVGPYIELKLNEIGIYNYDQIRRLKESDIRIITTLIDFFPGRIERDDWVGQAQQLQEN
ncbi:MAG: putative flap endonuclease-1-like 5' DNA nuclease [Ulvibacter sp.]|jgi:predicted flap endonuclease-1-like 5' DNA nuclease